ncbi:Glycosyl hydrolases family 43 [Paenibacillus sp. OK003]|nr:Glycosyl hydrolases family 43 [Paenibacillus sp. OK003]
MRVIQMRDIPNNGTLFFVIIERFKPNLFHLEQGEGIFKSPQPFFRKSTENGVYATGHNSFTTSPDGMENWIVYHALQIPSGE